MKQHETWLQKAFHDLQSSKKLITGDEPILDTAIYHTQQCAEKALKAFLAYHQKPILKTHDIQLLLELCEEIDIDFEDIYDDGIILSPYATEFRYPGVILDPDIADVHEAIIIAEKILLFVLNKTGSNKLFTL